MVQEYERDWERTDFAVSKIDWAMEGSAEKNGEVISHFLHLAITYK